MSTSEDFNSFQSTEETNSPVDVGELISKYLYHWPIFILGIFLCVFGAFAYLRYAQPIYSVTSTLLIKDEKKGGIPSGGDLLADLDLFGTSKVVDNEIEILKSKSLMRKVVDRLNLSVSFTAEGRIKSSDLYSSKPIIINDLQINNKFFGKTLLLSFPDVNTYRLESSEPNLVVEGTFDVLQRNGLGVYSVKKAANFSRAVESKMIIVFNDPAMVADQLLKQLTVSLASKQSTVLNLSLQSSVPQKGQDIINTLIQVYNEEALLDKNKTTASTIKFIDERLGLITGELTEVEKDVEIYKSSRGITDISNDASAFLESVKANDAKLNEINLQLSVVNDVSRYVNSNTPGEKLPNTFGINDPVLLSQITHLGEMQLQREQLLSTTTVNNPLVAPLIRQIDATKVAIKSSIANIAGSLQVAKSDLEGNSRQFQGSIKKIPGQERQLIGIKRQQTIKESLYLYLLQKKEEAALSYASSVADTRTVDPAFFSKAPVKPQKSMVYLAAIVLGLLLPIGYIYGKDTFNNKIESASDISKLTGTPVLGEISFNEDSNQIVVQSDSRKAIAEQFRAIRTNMQFLHKSRVSNKGKVTLLTSSMSGEGKSFVASNIAVALALSGRKTVLVELDLRKPKISKYLKLGNNLGLSNYIIGTATISDIVQPSNIEPNLFVVGSGPIPPNPSELIIQNELDILISYLVDNYDEIIIDSPPIGLVTDAQILSKFADTIIYLVRQHFTFKFQLKQLDQLYRSKKLLNLNVILNGIKAGSSYGYGYGYGYGYYSDDVNDTKTLKSMFNNISKRF